jgi:glycosyltransferase involved in cell wall biosynthesis
MRKKILFKGPLLTRSGYGEQSRYALRAMRTREDLFDIYIQPLKWGQTSWLFEMTEERQWIDQTIEKTIAYIQQGGTFDMSFQVTIPNEWEKIAPVNIGYTAGIETSKVAPIWLKKGNEDVDRIITISSHSKNTYQNTVAIAEDSQTNNRFEYKLQTPIDYVNYPTKKYESLPKLDLNVETSFNFLSIAQFGPRKNLPNTVKWFVEEFKDEDVGLVLKTNITKNSVMDRDIIFRDLKKFLDAYPDRKCRLYLLHGDMTDEEIHSLYKHPKVDAFLALPHGEGFGLPIFEAAYSALPVVATGWSGHLDFLVDEEGTEHFYNVAFDMQPVQENIVWDGVIIKESMWAYPREQSAKTQMRLCYEVLREDHAETRRVRLNEAKAYAKVLHERFDADKLYKQFISYIHDDETESVSLEHVPKISLITSVFKAAEHIDQLMEDVTTQTIFESHCEWIILNANAAGDDYEEEVIMKYQKKYPSNIIYKRLEEDPGVYDTWNMGIKMATGDFVTNVNCDDRRAKWAFETQAKMLVLNEDTDLVYNDSYITHESNMIWTNIKPDNQRYNFEQFSKEAMLRGNLPHNNPMWRKSLHDKYGYFNQHYKSAGDWEFWLRCAFGGSKFKKADEVLGVYYFNPEGMSTNPEHDSWKKEHEREIFQKYLSILHEQE